MTGPPFRYFIHTQKSDDTHYFIISKIVQHFGWNWVGVIRFDNDREDSDDQLLKYYLSRENICIEFTLKITSDNEKIKSHKETIKKSSSNVIICCGPVNVKLAGRFNDLLYMLREKTLIVSYNWIFYDYILDFGHKAFNGSFLIVKGFLEHFGHAQSVHSSQSDYRQFFEGLQPSQYFKDKLLENIWMEYYGCLSDNHKKNEFYEKQLMLKLLNCSEEQRVFQTHIFEKGFHSQNMLSAASTINQGLEKLLKNQTLGMNRKSYSYRYEVSYITALI
uniref:Receptor ligand binding region domain-containing protein n=1 Tax=Xenopus tropicalis TaxID=8364 RepID=A0A1B8Y498_XENTR